VRGPEAHCGPLSVGPQLCLLAISFKGEPLPEVPFLAVLAEGGTRDVGVTNGAGVICVDRSVALEEYDFVLGCVQGTCAGLEKSDFARTLMKQVYFLKLSH